MKDNNKWDISLKNVIIPVLLASVFYGIAIWRFSATGKEFYLYNFGYIGTALALGIFFFSSLPKKHVLWGRRISQLLIGLYMLVYLGFILKENMQIEGFFFYLMMGVFAGATLHYFIAKIAGTVIFGRGWCGWACWTAMILDLLPWKKPKNGRIHSLGILRYFHFLFSLGIVLYFWFILDYRAYSSQTLIEVYWLVTGNFLYYLVGILLASMLKDNRAFCKYICPIPVLQKIGSRFSLLKIEIDLEKCIDCGMCEKICPMDIKLLDYKNNGQRVLSTECILCLSCVNVCPKSAVGLTNKLDTGKTEFLNYRKENE